MRPKLQMVCFLMVFFGCITPVWGETHSLLAGMVVRFNTLDHYTTLLDSEGEDGRNRIVYTYKKPGYIRMDFIRPHKGARLIYNPLTERVSLRPFATGLLQLDLAPDNRMITDPKGHTVDRSDIGSLIASAMRYADEGVVTAMPPERVEGKQCRRLLIEGKSVTYLLWVHPEIGLPIKVVKLFSEGGQETVFLRNLVVDGPLRSDIFIP